MIKKIIIHYPLILLITLYVLFSLLTYKDYGITADEELEYKLGKNLVNYFTNKPEYYNLGVLHEKPYLKYYSNIYPMFVSIINFKGYYEWYHLLNMLFATSILVAAYILIYYEYKSKFKALAGPILILLVPSFLGSIPTNPKDTPFAVMYFICFVFVYILSSQTAVFENIKRYQITRIIKLLVLGLLLGVTQSQRIIGYSLYLIYLINALYTGHLLKRGWKYVLVVFFELSFIAIFAHLVMFLTYPYIGENIANIFSLISVSKNFTPWDRTFLYFGEILTREERPWHYLLTYILLTTPLALLLTHFTSFIYIKRSNLVRVLLLTIYLNILMYLVLNPVVYNSLRHFLYLMPLIAMTCAIVIVETINIHKRLLHLYVLLGLLIVFQMYELHPYNYLYFNEFTRRTWIVEDLFETDYWGASYKEATGVLIEHIDRNNIVLPNVYACNVDYSVRYYSMYKFDIVNSRSKANFIICDYQYDKLMDNTDFPIIYTIEKDGIKLNLIRENITNTVRH